MQSTCGQRGFASTRAPNRVSGITTLPACTIPVRPCDPTCVLTHTDGHISYLAAVFGSADSRSDDGANSDGETLASIREERDKLASSLAEMNRAVQELRERANGGSPGGGSPGRAPDARQRRKEKHKSAMGLRTNSRVEELEEENERVSY